MRNVVLVTYDSLRADHVGHHGYERDTTPTLDAMAEEGVTFENAIAPASRTNPSMASTFTGEPMVVRDRVADPEYARSHLRRHGTLAERMSELGYTTGAFNPNAYASRYYGFDRGFDTFEDFLFSSDRYQSLFEEHLGDSSLVTTLRNLRNLVRRQEAFKTWNTYVDQIEEWVRDQTEPFFLWVFSLDTHFPHLMPREYREWSNVVQMYYYNWRCNQLIDEFDIDLSEREKQKIIDIYDDSILFADALLAELRERLDEFDPVFVVHGDHGEAFDEHGVYGHFYPSLYEENVRVPLVVSEGDATGAVDRPISLLELPELVERVGTESESDLAELTRDWVVATDYDGRFDRNLTAIRTRDLKYLRTTEGDETRKEFYDLAADPVEQENLVDGDHPADEPLSKLAARRDTHERELLAIEDAAAEIDDIERRTAKSAPPGS